MTTNLINEEVMGILKNSSFLTLTTMCPSGKPHTIAVKGAESIEEERSEIHFKIFKMHKTKSNLNENGLLQVIALFEMKGYRLDGAARIEKGSVIFNVSSVESLL